MPVAASMLHWLPTALNEIPALSLAYQPWETQAPVTSPLLSPLQVPGLLPVLREFSPGCTFRLKTLSPDLDHNGPLWLRTSSNSVSLERPGPFPKHTAKQPLFLQALPPYRLFFLHSTCHFLKISRLFIGVLVYQQSPRWIYKTHERQLFYALLYIPCLERGLTQCSHTMNGCWMSEK